MESAASQNRLHGKLIHQLRSLIWNSRFYSGTSSANFCGIPLELRLYVIHDGSRDSKCDAARVLLAMGITGKLTLLDGKIGKPRTTIDYRKASEARCGGREQGRSSFP